MDKQTLVELLTADDLIVFSEMQVGTFESPWEWRACVVHETPDRHVLILVSRQCRYLSKLMQEAKLHARTILQVFRSILAWCEQHKAPEAFPELFKCGCLPAKSFHADVSMACCDLFRSLKYDGHLHAGPLSSQSSSGV